MALGRMLIKMTGKKYLTKIIKVDLIKFIFVQKSAIYYTTLKSILLCIVLSRVGRL